MAAPHALVGIESERKKRPARQEPEHRPDRTERIAENPPPVCRRAQNRQQQPSGQRGRQQRDLRARFQRNDRIAPPVQTVVALDEKRLPDAGRVPSEKRIRIEKAERHDPAAEREQDRNQQHQTACAFQVRLELIPEAVEADQPAEARKNILHHAERTAERAVEPARQQRGSGNDRKQNQRHNRKPRERAEKRRQELPFRRFAAPDGKR